MPSIFSHAIFATVVGKAYVSKPPPLWFWVLTGICAILPDADAIGFAFGVPYNSMLGHRGITHSIAFAVLTGLVVGTIVSVKTRSQFSRIALILYFTLVTLSHSLLDAMTNGGRGVALFAPFSGNRYFLPWRPIEVSPIGIGFFSARGLEVVVSEIVWVWLPAILILVVVRLFGKKKQANAAGS